MQLPSALRQAIPSLTSCKGRAVPTSFSSFACNENSRCHHSHMPVRVYPPSIHLWASLAAFFQWKPCPAAHWTFLLPRPLCSRSLQGNGVPLGLRKQHNSHTLRPLRSTPAIPGWLCSATSPAPIVVKSSSARRRSGARLAMVQGLLHCHLLRLQVGSLMLRQHI